MKSLIIAAYFFSAGYVACKNDIPEKISRAALMAWDELNRRSAAQFLNEVERRNLPAPERVKDGTPG